MHVASRHACEKVLRNLVQDFVFMYIYIHALARRPFKQKVFSLGRNRYCFGCNSRGTLPLLLKKWIEITLPIHCRMFGWILEFFEDPFFCMVITLTSAFRGFNIKHCKRRLTYCMDSVKEPWFSWSILVCPKVNLRDENAQKIVETQRVQCIWPH